MEQWTILDANSLFSFIDIPATVLRERNAGFIALIDGPKADPGLPLHMLLPIKSRITRRRAFSTLLDGSD
ncbi:MAG: hypothetical protein KDC80_03345 [Saprospiraceae bacterium]|nr:hypothetical protein [Saprospiraceae bacterium]